MGQSPGVSTNADRPFRSTLRHPYVVALVVVVIVVGVGCAVVFDVVRVFAVIVGGGVVALTVGVVVVVHVVEDVVDVVVIGVVL